MQEDEARGSPLRTQIKKGEWVACVFLQRPPIHPFTLGVRNGAGRSA